MMENSTATSFQHRLASNYSSRLNDALIELFPDIALSEPIRANSLDELGRLINRLGRTLPLNGLGFEFGMRVKLSDYGLVGLAMASSRNLREALTTQLRFLTVITDASRFRYELVDSNKWLTLIPRELTPAITPPHRFTIESEIGAQIRLVMDLLPNRDMSQCIVTLPYKRPSKRQLYKNSGGCQLKFGQHVASLKIPAQWGTAALETADDVLASMLAERCQLIMTELNQQDDWVHRVQSFLLTSETPAKSLSDTAEALGVSIAKLRWQLARSDTSYKQILLALRMKLACQFLDETPLTLQQISYQLGYRYPSNFQLAFKRYFDCSPGEWRLSRKPAALET